MSAIDVEEATVPHIMALQCLKATPDPTAQLSDDGRPDGQAPQSPDDSRVDPQHHAAVGGGGAQFSDNGLLDAQGHGIVDPNAAQFPGHGRLDAHSYGAIDLNGAAPPPAVDGPVAVRSTAGEKRATASGYSIPMHGHLDHGVVDPIVADHGGLHGVAPNFHDRVVSWGQGDLKCSTVFGIRKGVEFAAPEDPFLSHAIASHESTGPELDELSTGPELDGGKFTAADPAGPWAGLPTEVRSSRPVPLVSQSVMLNDCQRFMMDLTARALMCERLVPVQAVIDAHSALLAVRPSTTPALVSTSYVLF